MKFDTKNIKFAVMGAIAISSLAAISSCNSQLDEFKPHNVIFEERQFENAEGYTSAVIGAYSKVSGGATFSTVGYNYNDLFVFLSDSRSNTMRSLDAQINFFTDAFDYTNSSSRDFSFTYHYWRGSYNSLLHINKVLDHVAENETNSEILQAKAEALFLRAYVYFNLVRLYGKPYYQNANQSLGVMLVLSADLPAGYAPSRSTVGEVYNQIINDLETAIPLFTKTKSNSFSSANAANALLSRVYLYMGGTFSESNTEFNSKSIEYATKVINSGKYSLLKGEDYKNYYKTDNINNKEDIFSVNATIIPSQLGNLYAMSPVPLYSGGLYRPSPYFLSLLESADLRNSFLVNNETPGFPNDTKAIGKYLLGYTSLYTTSPTRYLRLAEMYLNRAEAYAKTGKTSEALSDLNIIRVRAGLNEIQNIAGQSLFNEILKQRKLELAFEGQDSFDHFRNGLDMVRDYESGRSGKITIKATDSKVLLKIPDEEIAANPNLVQNQ